MILSVYSITHDSSSFFRFEEWTRVNLQYVGKLSTRARWELYVADPELRQLKELHQAASTVKTASAPDAGAKKV